MVWGNGCRLAPQPNLRVLTPSQEFLFSWAFVSMLRFIKTLAYPLIPSTGSVFEYLDGVTQQRIDPPSLRPKQLTCPEPMVFFSPRRRVVECLADRTPAQQQMRVELCEIPFSLSALGTYREWEQGRSAFVRQKFVQAFIQDRLPVSRADIEHELRCILSDAKPFPDIALVSHSFRMKIFQAFIETDGQLFRMPELLAHWIHPHQKTFEFGEGFSVEMEKILGLLGPYG